MTPERFRDTGDYYEAYVGETLLVCPKCGGCARSFRSDPGNQSWSSPRRVTCGACGLVKEWSAQRLTPSGQRARMRDQYFGLELWIQARGPEGILWANNYRQLSVIECLVRATLRERRQGPSGWSNSSFVSRLPRWIKEAKNRKVILRRIEQLRAERRGRRTRVSGPLRQGE